MKNKFDSATPWPHLIIDNFMDENILEEVLANLPSPNVRHSKIEDYNNRSTATKINELHPSIRKTYDVLYGKEVCSLIESITQLEIVRTLEECVCSDGCLKDAGIHQTLDSGFMKVHRDPNHHPEKMWLRPATGILFLNKNWSTSNGGCLQLWDKNCTKIEKQIEPIFNRFVIMSNYADSYHSVQKVDKFTRISMCSFYYTKTKLGSPYDYLFVDSSLVPVKIKEIRLLPVDERQKAAQSAIDEFIVKYKEFDCQKFMKECHVEQNETHIQQTCSIADTIGSRRSNCGVYIL